MAGGQTNHAFDGDNGIKVAPRPSEKEELSDDEDVDLRFNMGLCKSKVLGKLFSNLYVFILCCGMSGLVSRIIPSSLGGLMKDLSAQFNLSPTDFANFSMANNIGMTVTVILVAYAGKKAPIPLTCGVLALLQGIVMTLPAIVQYFQPYHLPKQAVDPAVLFKENENRLCKVILTNMMKYMAMMQGMSPAMPPGGPSGTAGSGGPTTGTPSAMAVGTADTSDELSYHVFMAVVVITGMIQPAFFVLPPIFIDNNTINKQITGILLGTSTVITELAVPIGLLVNTAITKVPIDLEDTELTYEDPRFVGAWWITFLAFGLFNMALSIPLLGMPGHLVSKKKQREALETAMVTFAGGKAVDIDVAEPEEEAAQEPVHHHGRHSVHDAHLSPQYKGHLQPRVSIAGDVVYLAQAKDENTTGWQDMAQSLGELPAVAKRLFKNPIFDLLLLFVVCVTIVLRGAETFRFMYPVFEYNIDKNKVLYTFTVGLTIAMILGTVISAAISSRITTRSGYASVMAFCFVLIAAVTPIILTVPCGNTPIYGFDNDVTGQPMNQTAGCNCTNAFPENSYAPTCGSDGRTYYSPCYAACQPDISEIAKSMASAKPGEAPKLPSDFKLRLTQCSNMAPGNHSHTAEIGACDPGCTLGFWVFVIIFCGGIFAFQCSLIPLQLLMIRSIQPEDRSFGVGAIFFTMQCVAVPAPMLFGFLYTEVACLLSFSSGLCVVYDRDNLRYLMTGSDIVSFAAAAVVTVIVYFIERNIERRVKRQQANTPKLEFHGQDDGITTKM